MNKKEAQDVYMKSRKGYGVRKTHWNEGRYEYRDENGDCCNRLGLPNPRASCFNSADTSDWEEYYEIPSGFTWWEGGDCPVDGDAKVEVMFEDGGLNGVHRAKAWRWNATQSRIIAYKVIEEPKPVKGVCETCRYQGGSCETRRSNCAIPCGDWEKKSSFKPVEKRYDFEWDGEFDPKCWLAVVRDTQLTPMDCIFMKGFKHFIYGGFESVEPHRFVNGKVSLPNAVVFEEDGR
jgi:hypothetical protein